MRLLLIVIAIVVGVASAQEKHVSIPTSDGGVIAADLYGTTGERGVVLAHGGRFTKESWREQAMALVSAGFRVLAFDFRGFGQSHGPGEQDLYTAPVHLDVLAAVRYLHGTLGVKTVSVVGGSFGGAAAGDAAMLAAPHEISKLVLLAGVPNQPADKLIVPTLVIVARDDANGDGPRLPGIRAQYDRMRGPKELIVVPGSAHAQYLFQTDQGPKVMHDIVRFLAGPGMGQ